MARTPKPWFWKARSSWCVNIDGKRHMLGDDKKIAYDRFYALMRQPKQQRVAADSLPEIIDHFLEWVSNHRSPDTYEWYRYRLQRFVERYPDFRAIDLKLYHVENWADDYCIKKTSRRNYLRSVKRALKWAKQQGTLLRIPSRICPSLLVIIKRSASLKQSLTT